MGLFFCGLGTIPFHSLFSSIVPSTPLLVLFNKKACHWGRPGDGVSKARSPKR
ncbi:hypothetical protein SynBIOSE41_01517 [Synechococcus sp. BIOS-E4-1]|nr:hypothetical protein SynBIOSE41_01517 [Synechococcus sp. BIOS-E4-1]